MQPTLFRSQYYESLSNHNDEILKKVSFHSVAFNFDRFYWLKTCHYRVKTALVNLHENAGKFIN